MLYMEVIVLLRSLLWWLFAGDTIRDLYLEHSFYRRLSTDLRSLCQINVDILCFPPSIFICSGSSAFLSRIPYKSYPSTIFPPLDIILRPVLLLSAWQFQPCVLIRSSRNITSFHHSLIGICLRLSFWGFCLYILCYFINSTIMPKQYCCACWTT